MSIATPPSPAREAPAPVWPLGALRWLVRSRLLLGGVLLAGLVGYFAIRLPGDFVATGNLRSVIDQQAALLILALGVTLVLLIGEFDLSFSATIGLAGACSILMMSSHGLATGLAVLLALLVGLAIGVGNGLAVTYGRAPAFIATLAIGFMATGVERLLTDDKTISEGVPNAYLQLTLKQYLGFPLSTWGALLLVVVFAVVMSFTTYGRRIRATGMNPTAVTLAGIPVQLVRITAFAILGMLAGLVGVILTSQGASYFPNSGTGLLLPPYSAVFLGAAIVGRGRFSPLGTLYGVAFIALLERGLVMLDQPSAVIQLIEGGVLVAAVILARQERSE
jgi:ribose transport system permease protein